MKTREQLEALFDSQDFEEKMLLNGIEVGTSNIDLEKVKNFIFNELIPEVLREIIDIRTDEYDETDGDNFEQNFSVGCRVGIERIKQKAEELGFII